MIYDVAIIGSGPSGIFAALELVETHGLSVLLLESVKRIHDTRNVSNGWFGGSARSDLKLFTEPGFGGRITDEQVLEDLLDHFRNHTKGKLKKCKDKLNKRFIARTEKLGVSITEPQAYIIPSDKLSKAGSNIQDHLAGRVVFKSNCEMQGLSKQGRQFHINTSKGLFVARKCIMAMGRGGPVWLGRFASELKLKVSSSSFDLGVRLEFPHHSIRKTTDRSSTFRLSWGNYRTSAISTRSLVEMENVHDLKTSNGRSMQGKPTPFSNVALLKTFDSENALASLTRLVNIANVLADGQLIKEPIIRILSGKSILSPVVEYDSLRDGIMKMFDIFPNIQRKCYMYAPEARLNVLKFDLSNWMESSVKGLYIAGDMSGHTKSFGQAACSGMLAARHILKKV